ncbi:hypothetical protein Ae201684P_003647 [Aphanomyces euteiches]|uniref:Uncharacterized protein n=1 Tax=Aphanomyces euteiches TaxID=100861 RepID=A0A6G0W5U5_9STRA|nr:hypothetical protein Ae201684_018395 [Aphanomyces euteiches]KAH9064867.1 hypothetical protein Ae201684P_003647 [Aphanomyces euteiches]
MHGGRTQYSVCGEDCCSTELVPTRCSSPKGSRVEQSFSWLLTRERLDDKRLFGMIADRVVGGTFSLFIYSTPIHPSSGSSTRSLTLTCIFAHMASLSLYALLRSLF